MELARHPHNRVGCCVVAEGSGGVRPGAETRISMVVPDAMGDTKEGRPREGDARWEGYFMTDGWELVAKSQSGRYWCLVRRKIEGGWLYCKQFWNDADQLLGETMTFVPEITEPSQLDT